jgi:hypothetical protein
VKKHLRFASHRWLLAAAVLVLLALHGSVLLYVAQHAALSTSVLGGVIILVVIKHLGWFGAVYAWLKSRARSGG